MYNKSWPIRCAHTKKVPIGELKPHPDNPNEHSDEQIKELAEILEYQGWRAPIKVSKRSGFITCGEGRLLAARLGKQKLVPVDFQDYKTDEQEYADVVADNAMAQRSAMDLTKIKDKIKSFASEGDDFESFDVGLLGLEDFKIDDTVAETKETEEIPPVEEQLLVVVECEDEKSQRKLFEELDKRGFKCKIMS